MNRLNVVVAAFASLLCAQSAFAGGFQINEHSARATGRGSSVVATVDDPSAIFYNAAGLTSTEGTQAIVGVSLIKPRGKFQPDGGGTETDALTSFIPVPYGYVSRALSTKAFVGFGFYAPYGLGIKWTEEGQEGTFIGSRVIDEIELRTFFLTPAIALKLSDMLSVAVSVSLVPATVYLRRTLGAQDNFMQSLFPASRYGSEGVIRLSASAFGVGANAGIQVTLIDHLKIGFNFRSAVDLSFSGDADFTIPEGVPSEIKQRFPDGDGDADLTLPHAFALGVGWVDGPLKVEIGAQLTLWSSFKELRINFASGLPVPSQAAPRNWTTSVFLRAGGEYNVTPDLALRLGAGYDTTPVPETTVDPTLPDNDRILFTLGAGYDFGPVRFDAGYMGLILGSVRTDNSVNFPIKGEFTPGLIHVIAISAGVEI